MLNSTANTWSKYQNTGVQVNVDGKYLNVLHQKS